MHHKMGSLNQIESSNQGMQNFKNGLLTVAIILAVICIPKNPLEDHMTHHEILKNLFRVSGISCTKLLSTAINCNEIKYLKRAARNSGINLWKNALSKYQKDKSPLFSMVR